MENPFGNLTEALRWARQPETIRELTLSLERAERIAADLVEASRVPYKKLNEPFMTTA